MHITISKQIQTLIGTNQEGSALTLLSEYLAHSHRLDEAIALQARWHEVQSQIQQDVISHNQANQNKNRIRLAILQLVRELAADATKDQDQPNKPTKDLPEQARNIRLIHHGSGDNIYGTKIVNQKKSC